MYEYEIMNKATGKHIFVWGVSFKDAMKREKLQQDEWICLNVEYID